jgi:hypothetical protein
MRKNLLFVAALLFMAVPAMAASNVNITCTNTVIGDVNWVTVSYASDHNRIRAFGLTITMNTADANIKDACALDPNYWIYPGQIVINSDGQVTDFGRIYDSADINDANLAVEMGSLYTTDANHAGDPCSGYNKVPGLSGNLFKFSYKNSDPGGSIQGTIDVNVLRGGVVMEDPCELPTTNLPVNFPGGPPPTPPDPAVDVSPVNGDKCQGTGTTVISITLSWTPGARTDTQDVYFGTTNPPPKVASDIPVGTTTYVASGTTYTKYYWRIDEKNGAGTTTGTVWCFTTGAQTGKPCCQNESGTPCLGNVNGDTRVNSSDVGALTAFISALGSPYRCTTAAGSATCPPCYDLNGDGRVNSSDVGALTALISSWGSPYRQTCPWLKCP